MGCNPAVVSAGNYHCPLLSKSFRCSSLTQHQSWLKLNGKNFHFLFSNPKKKVCNEVNLPVRPLSLKVFPVEAVSVWWDQLLVLQPVKSRHFWNTCYIKETLWEKPLSTIGMFSCFSLLEWKFPHFFLPSKLQLIIKSMSWRLKEETQNINHFFSLQTATLFMKNITSDSRAWTKISNSFLTLPKNPQSCFPDH